MSSVEENWRTSGDSDIATVCHRVEEAKNFRCCTTDCLCCNVIGGEIFLLQKVINVNEARGISQMSPDLLS